MSKRGAMSRQRPATTFDFKELESGTRVRLSALGKKRCAKMTRQTGVIVGKSIYKDAFRILMDGSKEAIALHHSYIEAD
jgi:hypothetical protein